VIAFGRAVLRRFVIGCIAVVVAVVVLGSLQQNGPPAATSDTCDALIASGATDICEVIDEDGTSVGGAR
jgi:hypothetical protein